MEEALGWLNWLEGKDAKLVWARATNQPWKQVCWQFGMSRPSAWRRWVMALCIISMNLNGERVRADDRNWRQAHCRKDGKSDETFAMLSNMQLQ